MNRVASPVARAYFHEWFSARINALATDAVLMRLRNLASAVLFFAAAVGLGTVALAVTAVEPTREFPWWGMLLVRVAAAFGMMLFLWLSWIKVAAGSGDLDRSGGGQ